MAKTRRKKLDREATDTNPDPLTGAHGAHPFGVGVGSAGGAAAGAALGAAGGPVGVAVGAVVGGVAGGLAGKGVAEVVNPTVEEAYWRDNYASRPYVQPGRPFEAYRPAYRAGWEAAGRYGELNWEKTEPKLRRDWEEARDDSDMDWDEARAAARDAWDRVRPGVRYSRENR